MASITIRNVPEELHAILTERARMRGQSLQEYLLSELNKLAQKPDVDVWLATLEAERRENPVHINAEEILALRDSQRP